MADPPQSSSSAPKRILRRAANLLTTNGQPVEALSFHTERASSLPNRTSGTSSGQNGHRLGPAIRRKFKHVKDASLSLGRSKSVSLKPLDSNEEAQLRRKAHHTRSQSFGARPTNTLLHTVSDSSVPPPRPISTKRFSLSRMVDSATNAFSRQSHVDTNVPHEGDQSDSDAAMAADIVVPELLQRGTPMTKVSNKKQKKFVFSVDADLGQIAWESKTHKIIAIESIKEMRFGSDARYYREQFQLAQEYEDRWITIIYILDGDYKTLHLIASTKDVYNMWNTTLRKLHGVRQELMSGIGHVEMRQAIWEKHYWKGADLEHDQKLEYDEVERLCKRLNINTSPDDLQRLFKQADVHNRNYLDFQDFRRFVKLLKTRPELDRLYKKLRAEKGVFDFDTFEKFTRETQKSTLSREDLKTIFEKFSVPEASANSSSSLLKDDKPVQGAPITPTSPPEAASTIQIMTCDSFTSFLLSTENSPLLDTNRDIWHDMTRPLSEYYISSSHNTYLVGHQLVGVSTIEGYIRALLHSCRSVEVDIYDGDTEPMIYHGKTWTSKVSLREVCEAIMKYGFVSSPYPIIISAEIHCGVAQQDMMVDIMTSVFGDALMHAPINGRPCIAVLPSPEDLKGRILLKAKNLHIARQSSLDTDPIAVEISQSSTSDSDMQDVKNEWEEAKRVEHGAVKELKQEFKKARNMLSRVRSPHKASSTPNPQIKVSPSMDSNTGKTKIKMSVALLSLLVYTVGVKCRGINKKEEYAPEHLFSLSEGTANKMLKAGMVDLIKHNRTHIVRIYPKGMRLSSSNYLPHRYWSAGCQLVAINWQTFDLGYTINHTMFQRNGRSGYVLKPTPLRVPHKDMLSQRTNHHLDINIISAQQLPRPKDSSGREIIDKSIIDPVVEVSLHVPDWTHSTAPSTNTSSEALRTSSTDSTLATAAHTLSYRTQVVKNNGFNPVWEEKLRIPFSCVGDMKDLIFVRFLIRQQGDKDDDEPLALFCASLGTLQQGYRHLPLHDAQLSQYLFSTLFVHIGILDA